MTESVEAFRYQAVIDTPLGVISRRFSGKTGRGVLVTAKILKAVAEDAGFSADECELLTVTSIPDGKILYGA